MDMRTAFNNGTVLRFENDTAEYTIQKERARGGACIVYNAFYTDNIGNKKPILIKECYPFKLNISRDHAGSLIPAESDVQKFKQAKERMQESYEIGNELFQTDGLTNYVDDTYNFHKGNNTVYIVSRYSQGDMLSYDTICSLKEGISIVKSVAIAIQKIHNKGYLYLDIKPDNIFIYKETTDMVRLFDFDTLIPVDIRERDKNDYDYQISYTKGFAPLEQIEGNKKKIGKCSDVYGIGALLFYLIFHRAPNAPDCDYDAEYDFSLMKYSEREYQDKLFFRLQDFFHHTLAHYYLDRFQDMEDVVEKLDELVKLSDTSIPFIYSSKISEPSFIIGREKENDYLNEWFAQNRQNCLFIVGMTGIGKSTLIESFLARNAENFDAVIKTNYNTSIVRTIIDDTQIRMNTIKQEEDESSDKYFTRKLNAIRELALGKKLVLIIDDYTGETVQDFSAILNVDWKVVLITHTKSFAEGYETLEVGAIQDNENLYSLFEHYLGRSLCKGEYPYLDNVIKEVAGHTFILQLIAKHITTSYISLAEASSLVEKHGFSNIAPEKVYYTKDSITYRKTIKDIIHDLFDAAHLSEIKSTLLKIISLFGRNGIDREKLLEMLELSSNDCFNELNAEGWISMEDNHISMHPVIIEVMHQIELTENAKEKAVQIMDYLWGQMVLEGKREEYPKKLLKRMQFVKELCEQNERVDKYIQQSKQKAISTKGVTGKICSKRFEQCERERTTDHKKLDIYLKIAESFLEECKKENSLCVLDNYKSLMYQTIMHLPRERENFILREAEVLVNDPSLQNAGNMRLLLNLYNIIISVYKGKGDFQTEKDKFDEAKSKLRPHNNFVSGECYYLWARYDAASLSGHYDTEMGGKEKFTKLFISNINKAIHYMKKARDLDSEQRLGEYYCFKAFVLIREKIGNPNEIKELLNKTEELIEKNAQSYSKLVKDYNMAYAWYYTNIEHDFVKVEDYISEAYGIAFNVSRSDIDKIDEIISIIEIYSKWEKYEAAISWIRRSIKLCNNHKNILAYLRKELELLKIWLDISYNKQDFETCKVILRGIEEDAVMVGVNIEQIVPSSLQEKIYSK